MPPHSTSLDPGIIARVSAGVKFVISGVDPNGFFTPQQPIQPMAQDKAAGRQFDYITGANIQLQPKVNEGSGISFWQLRQLADSLDVLRIVIETRKDQVAAMDWHIVAKDGKTVSDDTLAEIEAQLRQPTPEYDWDMWLRMLLEDVFVIDAVAIYPRMTRGGGLYSLDLIDGATIKRVIDDGGRTPIAPDPAYQQILKGIPAVDYTTDDLIYRVRNPRTNRLYGFSPVEQIVMTVNIALRRQLTQLQYFTEGNIPEALASVPETWNPDQVAQFQLYYDSLLSGNTAARSRLKFVPLDTSKIKETRDPMLKDVFDEWLARVICYCFSISPTPFIKDNNRATADAQKDTATQEGLVPTLNWVKRLIDSILLTRIGNKDVEFSWQQDEALAPLEQAQIDRIYHDSGIRTVNEIRSDRGWEPLSHPETPTPAPGETIVGSLPINPDQPKTMQQPKIAAAPAQSIPQPQGATK